MLPHVPEGAAPVPPVVDRRALPLLLVVPVHGGMVAQTSRGRERGIGGKERARLSRVMGAGEIGLSGSV